MNINSLLESIGDPSDWTATKLPELSQLDALQRCFICKEFLKAPVTTGCSHTFCSQCIREYLIANSRCPLCKTEQFESNLRRNVLLDEIISCYVSCRPHLLELLKPTKETTQLKKRPASPAEVVEILSDETSDVGLLTSLSTTNSSSPFKRQKREPRSSSLIAQSTSPSPSCADQMAECPICGDIMPADIIERKHLDDCLKGKKSKPYLLIKTKKTKNTTTPHGNIQSFFMANAERKRQVVTKRDHEHYYFQEAATHNDQESKKLPKLDFSSLSTSKLKEKLNALDVPTSGSRQQLELRYNHYYVLYNSNLDSNHPVVEKVLRLKLSQWESSHLVFAPTTRYYNSSKSITDKDFLPSLWVASHKEEFIELTRAAKATLKAKAKKNRAPEKKSETPESDEENKLDCDQSLLFSVPGT